MDVVWILVGSTLLILLFLILWLRERRRARIEYVAYGLRASEEANENTKTNLTQMQAEYVEAMTRLEELGQVRQDNWGRWVWTENGQFVGDNTEND